MNRTRSPRPRRLLPAALVGLLLVLAGLYGREAYTYDAPAYLATAAVANPDGTIGNVNLLVRDGVAEVQAPRYDERGHAALPSYAVTLPGTGISVPAAPVMNWEFAPARQAAAGTLALRVSFAELQAFDRQYGTRAEADARAVLGTIWARYELLPWVEVADASAHMVLGASAGVDCAMEGAVGCAALRGTHMRITFNGPKVADGTYGQATMTSAFLHEVGHFFNLGHTDCNHPQTDGHPTVMSAIYPNGPLCGGGSLGTFDDYPPAEGYYALRRRTPGPRPTASPTPAPTRTATPTPTATPQPATQIVVLRYEQVNGQWQITEVPVRGNAYLTVRKREGGVESVLLPYVWLVP